MIWPLHLTNLSDPYWYGVAERSIDRWLATPELDSMFYRPIASKMNVMLGRKAAAYSNISILVMTRVTPNTFYNEGTQGSCTETPYAAAWAISELLVQSYNGVIDFFPGVLDHITKSDPNALATIGLTNASFYHLRTEGAFLVSARRFIALDNATHRITGTDFVAVTSQAGQPCFIKTNMARPLVAVPSTIQLTEMGGGVVKVSIGNGVTAIVFSSHRPITDFRITGTPGNPEQYNYWGFPSKRNQ